MVMMKCLFLAGLMLTYAMAQDQKNPVMSTLHVQSNFDFGLARKEFRVHYSGLGEGFSLGSGEKVKITIHKKVSEDESTEIHSFEVKDAEKPKAYHLALIDELKDKYDGKFTVEVCVEGKCSGKNPALTDIEKKETKLTCLNDKLDQASRNVELSLANPNEEWISLSDYPTVESELRSAYRISNAAAKMTEFSRNNLNKNPIYKRTDRLFYVALKYNIVPYKNLFVGNGYCSRKYMLSIHAHLVKEETKVVAYRFKTTLYLADQGKEYYMLSPDATGRKVPVELLNKNADIDDGEYTMHVSFCATDKDTNESTFCTEPITKPFKVENGIGSALGED